MRLFGYEVRLAPELKRTIVRSADNADISNLKDPSDWLYASLLGMAQNSTGIRVTPLRAYGIASVFACVRVLADAVSSLPLGVYKWNGRVRVPAPEHPLYDILRLRPNGEMTSFDCRWAMIANLALRSNAYCEIIRDMDNDVAMLYPIESYRVNLYRRSDQSLIYQVTNGWQSKKSPTELPFRDVLHIKQNTFDGLVGVDVLSAEREVIALALALQENAAKFFGNMSMPGGVIEHPNSLSEAAADRLRTQVEQLTMGKNAHRLLVLEEGLKYVAQRMSNRDSQFDESRDKQDLNICRIFGVPPHKIGITGNQPRANVEQENLSFVTDRIRPICYNCEQNYDLKLFTEEDRDQGYHSWHDFDDLLRGDRKSRYEANAIARQWSALTADEWREEEGRGPIPGGDVALQPLNMADVKLAGQIQLKGNTKGVADTAPQKKDKPESGKEEDPNEDQS